MGNPLAPSLALALLLAGCSPAGAQRAAQSPSAPSPLLAQPVPAFQRRTVNGEEISTAKLKGQVTIVKFFAKYCEPCKRTLPAVERLHEQRPEIAMIGISEDEHEADVRELIAQYGLSFSIILDRDNVLAGRFRVTEMPRTFVVDSGGVVRWVAGPDQTDDDLIAAVGATH